MQVALYVVVLLLFLWAVEYAANSRRMRQDAREYEALTDDERVAYHIKQFEKLSVFDSKGKRTVATLMARTKQKPTMSDDELAALITAMTTPIPGDDQTSAKRGLQVVQSAMVVISYSFSPAQMAVLIPAVLSVYENDTFLQMAKSFCFIMLGHLQSDALASEARKSLRHRNISVRIHAKSYLQSLRDAK